MGDQGHEIFAEEEHASSQEEKSAYCDHLCSHPGLHYFLAYKCKLVDLDYQPAELSHRCGYYHQIKQ